MRRDQNNRGRLLVVYDNSTNFVSTIAEYLDSISRYSDWDVHYLHATHGAEIAFDLNEFDAIVQSYCASYVERLADPAIDWYLSPDYIVKRKAFRGVKVLAVQDEYQYTDRIRQAIREVGYHIVLTNAPPALVERIYPPDMFPETEFVTVLTGYVPENISEPMRRAPPLRDRPIVVGYRGRDIGGLFGRLAFDKLEIGRRMRAICIERGIPHDIEWSEDKRLYGDAWYDFIGSCRVNLGSETGSNVFDFDGSIAAKYRELAAARGGPVPYEEFRLYTDAVEDQYDMGQISPRVFEAAAMRTPMILFAGRYLGLIEPDEHYIELKKDFSNIDAVLGRLDDLDGLERLADRAYDRLVGSGDFSYRRFVERMDACVFRKAAELDLKLRPPWSDMATAVVRADPGALFSLREHPTKAPRHSAFFRYKIVARLQAEIARLGAEYSAEIARGNSAHANEIAQLRHQNACEISGFRAEIEHLNAEINNLRRIIAEVRSRLRWLIAIYNFYKSRIGMLNAFMRSRSARIARGRVEPGPGA